jgi:diguanylate cyclase (GGDEF)-like protein
VKGDQHDRAPLADRVAALLAVRLAMAVVVLAFAAASPETVGATAAGLAPVTAVWLLVSAGGEWARRVARRTGLVSTSRLLLLDGVWVAIVLGRTGGSRSVLGFLVYLHVVAVTLLLSYRTGLKVALWHGVLLFFTYYLLVADLLSPDSPVPGLRTDRRWSQDASAFGAVAFWLVALATAAFSSLNERELRRGKGELHALAAMAAEMDTLEDPVRIRATLEASVRRAFGVPRAVAVAPGLQDAAVLACLERRAPVLVARLDPVANPGLAAALPGARNVVVVPLVAVGEAQGALVVERGGRAGARIARRTVDMLGQFGTHAALALRTAGLLAEVRRLASVDALTGLANRRVFEEALEREVARALRSGDALSLVVLDLDHFKDVNDTHGHHSGDEVLRAVASGLRAASRAEDLPARYGGEEFVVLLPRCGPQEAVAVAERMREAVAREPGPVPVTVSAGVASYPVHAIAGPALVQAADEALYEAKRGGRDRTVRSSRRPPRAPARRRPLVAVRAS